jgi:hypothetical protein
MFPFGEKSCDSGVIFERILRIGGGSSIWIARVAKKALCKTAGIE